MSSNLFLFFFLFTLRSIDGGKILFSTFGRNVDLLINLADFLKGNGHEVTFLTYANDPKLEKKSLDQLMVKTELDSPLEIHPETILKEEKHFKLLKTLCFQLFNDSVLYTKAEIAKFDVFLVDLYANDICSLYWAKRLNVPVIGFWPTQLDLPVSQFVGLSLLTEYDGETLFQRLSTIIYQYFAMKEWNSIFYEPMLSTIYEFYKRESNVDDLYKDITLLLVNQHPTLDDFKMKFRNVIDIGGFHCISPNQIPQEIEVISKKHRSGLVFLSFDSMVQFGNEDLKTFLKVFSNFPNYVFVWEINSKTMSGVNETNVVFVPEINQQDILGFPRTRLFISSCDSLRTMSTIYHGVPVLCIPFTKMETVQAKKISDLHLGNHLDLTNLNVDKLTKNIQILLLDKTFHHYVRQMSAVFRDQPETPSDRFVYWVEYVMRRKAILTGNNWNHSSLSSLKYYALDVTILFIFLSVLLLTVTCLVLIFTVKFLHRDKQKGKIE